MLAALAGDEDEGEQEFAALQNQVEERLVRIEEMRVMLEDRMADVHKRARATKNKKQMQPILADVQKLVQLQGLGLAEVDKPCKVLDAWLADYTAQMGSAAGALDRPATGHSNRSTPGAGSATPNGTPAFLSTGASPTAAGSAARSSSRAEQVQVRRTGRVQLERLSGSIMDTIEQCADEELRLSMFLEHMQLHNGFEGRVASLGEVYSHVMELGEYCGWTAERHFEFLYIEQQYTGPQAPKVKMVQEPACCPLPAAHRPPAGALPPHTARPLPGPCGGWRVATPTCNGTSAPFANANAGAHAKVSLIHAAC